MPISTCELRPPPWAEEEAAAAAETGDLAADAPNPLHTSLVALRGEGAVA
ncbi:MAG: hypothetical protein M3Z27_10650 [Actinomycetota bacterium]|nr:hypothetical protein [Actinomycetota bacterium]